MILEAAGKVQSFLMQSSESFPPTQSARVAVPVSQKKGLKAVIGPLATVLGVYVILILFIKPFGEFPLNDDWSYAKAVKIFGETGHVRFTSWLHMTFLSQLAYAAAVTKILGFSHLALRISTMILGGLTLVFFLMLLRSLEINAWNCALGGLVLLANPFFLGSSFTFMSDIPYLCALLGTTLISVKALDCERRALFLAGGIAASVAVLVRQTAIILPFILSAAVFVTPKRKGKWINALLFSIPPLVALLSFYVWLQIVQGGIPKTQLVRHLATPLQFLKHALDLPVVVIFYLSLLVLPLTVSLVSSWREFWKRSTTRTLLISFLVLTIIAYIYSHKGHWMPYLGNTWFDLGTFGQGPYSTKDVLVLFQTDPVKCDESVFIFATLVTVISGGLLVAVFWSACPEIAGGPVLVKFSLFAFLMHALFLLPMDFYLDRHLLPLYPFLIILLLYGTRRIRTNHLISLLALLPLFLMTVAGVRYYHRWNEARWAGINYLLHEKKATSRTIDGGFEFNGWMNYNDYFPYPKSGKSWWWVIDDKYVVTFSPQPGYTILKRIPFAGLVPGMANEMLVLERIDEP